MKVTFALTPYYIMGSLPQKCKLIISDLIFKALWKCWQFIILLDYVILRTRTLILMSVSPPVRILTVRAIMEQINHLVKSHCLSNEETKAHSGLMAIPKASQNWNQKPAKCVIHLGTSPSFFQRRLSECSLKTENLKVIIQMVTLPRGSITDHHLCSLLEQRFL